MKKGKVLFEAVALFTVVIFVISCATIVSGTKEKISINSEPPNASVKIQDSSGEIVWDSKTPTSTKLKRGKEFFKGEEYKIFINKEGYKEEVIKLEPTMKVGWYVFGNFLVGGLIGWVIIDPASGAMWKLRPKDIDAELAKEYGLYNDNGELLYNENGELMIVLKEEFPEALFNELNPKQIN